MLLCALLGALVGVLRSLADALCESAARHKGVRGALRFFFDLALVLFSGAQILFLSYYYNKGSIRLFSFLGFISTFTLVCAIFGGHLKRLFKWILSIIYKILCVFLSPFVSASKILVNILQKIIYFVAKALAKFGDWVYNINTSRYILMYSRNGFLKERKNRRRSNVTK